MKDQGKVPTQKEKSKTENHKAENPKSSGRAETDRAKTSISPNFVVQSDKASLVG